MYFFWFLCIEILEIYKITIGIRCANLGTRWRYCRVWERTFGCGKRSHWHHKISASSLAHAIFSHTSLPHEFTNKWQCKRSCSIVFWMMASLICNIITLFFPYGKMHAAKLIFEPARWFEKQWKCLFSGNTRMSVNLLYKNYELVISHAQNLHQQK